MGNDTQDPSYSVTAHVKCHTQGRIDFKILPVMSSGQLFFASCPTLFQLLLDSCCSSVQITPVPG